MAVAIPIIAAIGTGAGVAAGTIAVTAASVLTIAGGVVAGLGVIANDKDLKRIGGYLSLAGGLAGMATSAASAAGTAAEAGGAASSAADAAAATSSVTPATNAASQTPLLQQAGMNNPSAFVNNGAAGSGVAGTTPVNNPSAFVNDGGASSVNTPPSTVAPTSTPPAGGVDKAAQELTQDSLTSLLGNVWDKAKGVGSWMERNPQLVKIGADAVGAMYSPEAEMMDWKKQLHQQRLANMNSPIALGSMTPAFRGTGGG